MKKLILVFVLLISLTTLYACDTNEAGVLKVGMDLRYPPFEVLNNENPEGISVDVAYALGEYLGRDVEIVNLPFGSLITSLLTNEIDIIIGSMSITEERKQTIDFSEPYFYFPLVSVLNKTFYEANTIETIDDLYAIDGVRYAGQRGTVFLSLPLNNAMNPVIIETDNAALAMLEVTTGNADAAVFSLLAAAGNQLANSDTTVLFLDPLAVNPIGMGVRKGEDAFLAQVNQFIAGMALPGSTYDVLAATYNPALLETYNLTDAIALFTKND